MDWNRDGHDLLGQARCYRRHRTAATGYLCRCDTHPCSFYSFSIGIVPSLPAPKSVGTRGVEVWFRPLMGTSGDVQ